MFFERFWSAPFFMDKVVERNVVHEQVCHMFSIRKGGLSCVLGQSSVSESSSLFSNKIKMKHYFD